jgi:CheY-like chemotaxis protein
MRLCGNAAVPDGGARAILDSMEAFTDTRSSAPDSVLIVEDDEDLRDSMASSLRDAGFEVAVASHGLEALARLRSEARPGVILLDLMMPEMNGWELMATLQADPALRGIPILVMTASGLTPSSERACAVLKKPFSEARLVELVRQARLP